MPTPSEYSSICPITGMECQVRAEIISEISTAAVAAESTSDNTTRQVLNAVRKVGELLLVPVGVECSEVACGAASLAVKQALHPYNYVTLASD